MSELVTQSAEQCGGESNSGRIQTKPGVRVRPVCRCSAGCMVALEATEKLKESENGGEDYGSALLL